MTLYRGSSSSATWSSISVYQVSEEDDESKILPVFLYKEELLPLRASHA